MSQSSDSFVKSLWDIGEIKEEPVDTDPEHSEHSLRIVEDNENEIQDLVIDLLNLIPPDESYLDLDEATNNENILQNIKEEEDEEIKVEKRKKKTKKFENPPQYECEKFVSFYYYPQTNSICYLFKWAGYPYSQCTWEPLTPEKITNLKPAILKFNERMLLCAVLRQNVIKDEEERIKWFEEHRDKLKNYGSSHHNLTQTKLTFREAKLSPPYNNIKANMGVLLGIHQWEHEINSINTAHGAAPIYIENWVDAETRVPDFKFSLFYFIHESAIEPIKYWHHKIIREWPISKDLANMLRRQRTTISPVDPSYNFNDGLLNSKIEDIIGEGPRNKREKTFETPYDSYKTLKKKFFNTCVVYECFDECSCVPKCENKITSKYRKIPLVLFRTIDRGWSIRAACDIRSGAFISEYYGEIVSIEYSELHKSNPIYLFELCKPDVMIKEVTIEKKSEENEAPTEAPKSQETLETTETHTQVSQDRRKKRKRGRKAKQRPEVELQKTIYSDGLVVDAEKYGNEARFFNHSCAPNLTAFHVKRNVFPPFVMNTICLFANRHIKKGEELTFDYNDPNYRSLVIKQCYCRTKKCKSLKK